MNDTQHIFLSYLFISFFCSFHVSHMCWLEKQCVRGKMLKMSYLLKEMETKINSTEEYLLKTPLIILTSKVWQEKSKHCPPYPCWFSLRRGRGEKNLPLVTEAASREPGARQWSSGPTGIDCSTSQQPSEGLWWASSPS